MTKKRLILGVGMLAGIIAACYPLAALAQDGTPVPAGTEQYTEETPKVYVTDTVNGVTGYWVRYTKKTYQKKFVYGSGLGQYVRISSTDAVSCDPDVFHHVKDCSDLQIGDHVSNIQGVGLARSMYGKYIKTGSWNRDQSQMLANWKHYGQPITQYIAPP